MTLSIHFFTTTATPQRNNESTHTPLFILWLLMLISPMLLSLRYDIFADATAAAY